MLSKTCAQCGELFFRGYKEGYARWDRRLFCSTACSHGGRNVAKNTAEDFFKYAIPEPNSGCWLWAGGVGSHGYGQWALDGEKFTAHTFSYELHKGKIPTGLYVLHKCDVRCCVNPEHLYAGNQQQNVKDAISRGRIKTGEHSPSAKLTEDDVRFIRTSELSQRAIAAKLGISQPTVSAIKRKLEWSHVQ